MCANGVLVAEGLPILKSAGVWLVSGVITAAIVLATGLALFRRGALGDPLLNHKIKTFTPLLARIEQKTIDAMIERNTEQYNAVKKAYDEAGICLLYTSPSPRD